MSARIFPLFLWALGILGAGCSSSSEPTAATDPASTDDESDAGDVPPPCPANGISKGPWSMAMTREGGRIRWESCRAGSEGGLVLTPEGGGEARTLASTETMKELTVRHTAVLGPQRSPDDWPGPAWLHEVVLDGLSAGTCYQYALAADRSLTGRFCTARPDGADVHFVAIGDTNPLLGEVVPKLIAKVVPLAPDFLVHGGDIQYYESALETWTGWFPLMRPLLALGALQPALGNHEHETPDELDDYSNRFFGYPNFGGERTYYRYESAGIWFHVLDTELPVEPETPQGKWLVAGLEEVSKTPGFRFSMLVMHRPFVTCGDNAQNQAARTGYASALAQYKVPLVLQAHIHGYERFEIDGVTYITTGGGGGLIGDMDENVSRAECAMRKASGGFVHALDVAISGTAIHARAIDATGAERDSFDIRVP